MPNIPDGRYDRMKPGSGPVLFHRPWESNEERLVGQALESVMMSNAQVSMIPTPLPQVQLFPPKFGYSTETPGIADVMNLDRQTILVQSFSGGNSGYQGSSRNTLGMDT